MHRSLAVVAALLVGSGTVAAQGIAYGLVTRPDAGQQLVRFSPANPLAVTVLGFTGVPLTGLDFRPATGMLYGHDGRDLYVLDLATGVATRTAVGSASIAGNGGFDFNPTVDRIRIVAPEGTNLRVNPVTGEAIVDGAYRYALGDVAGDARPSFSGMAYTNSDADPATGTTLFGIDAVRGSLVRVAMPNGGDVVTVGTLGLAPGAVVTAFDILTMGGMNIAYVTATTGATTSRLYTVDLATGAATLLGDIGAGRPIAALAVTAVPEPTTTLLLAAGLAMLVPLARCRRTR